MCSTCKTCHQLQMIPEISNWFEICWPVFRFPHCPTSVRAVMTNAQWNCQKRAQKQKLQEVGSRKSLKSWKGFKNQLLIGCVTLAKLRRRVTVTDAQSLQVVVHKIISTTINNKCESGWQDSVCLALEANNMVCSKWMLVRITETTIGHLADIQVMKSSEIKQHKLLFLFIPLWFRVIKSPANSASPNWIGKQNEWPSLKNAALISPICGGYAHHHVLFRGPKRETFSAPLDVVRTVKDKD